jgi:hypothetical protein
MTNQDNSPERSLSMELLFELKKSIVVAVIGKRVEQCVSLVV